VPKNCESWLAVDKLIAITINNLLGPPFRLSSGKVRRLVYCWGCSASASEATALWRSIQMYYYYYYYCCCCCRKTLLDTVHHYAVLVLYEVAYKRNEHRLREERGQLPTSSPWIRHCRKLFWRGRPNNNGNNNNNKMSSDMTSVPDLKITAANRCSAVSQQ